MGLFVGGPYRPAGCWVRGRGGSGCRFEAGLRGDYDGFGGETKLLEQKTPGRTSAIVIDADDPAGVTDEVAPTETDPSLDRDAWPDLWRDD